MDELDTLRKEFEFQGMYALELERMINISKVDRQTLIVAYKDAIDKLEDICSIFKRMYDAGEDNNGKEPEKNLNLMFDEFASSGWENSNPMDIEDDALFDPSEEENW